ncbi:MAG: DUF3300 domain-containing protein, partial [Proteobacteria bacterium]
AQGPQPLDTPGGQSQTLLSPDELDSLVAPVALYPDPVLSQVLVASTYPVDIVEAARWLQENNHLSGKALAEAAAEEPWDASVQTLVMLPETLNRLNSEIRWTTDLGNAFMAQEEDVMDAIQRMRQKASASGALHSTPQQTVSTVTENNQTFIVIQPASPDVVYVPVYNPVAVWGQPAVPFPVMSYPSFGGLAAANAVSFGMGMAVGSLWGGGWGGWGWTPGWGRRTVIVNNNFIGRNRFNRANVGPGNRWVRNANRRGGGRRNERRAGNRGNVGSANRRSRPNAEQTRRRLEANRGQRGGRRAGEGSAARMRRGGSGEGQRARRGNAGRGVANRTPQARGQGRQNRAGNRQANRGSANRGISGGANRGGRRSAVGGNRGSANRGMGGSRRGGSGARGGASRARGGGGGARGGTSRARGGGGSRGGASRARGGGGGARGGGGRARGGGGGSRGGGRRR